MSASGINICSYAHRYTYHTLHPMIQKGKYVTGQQKESAAIQIVHYETFSSFPPWAPAFLSSTTQSAGCNVRPDPSPLPRVSTTAAQRSGICLTFMRPSMLWTSQHCKPNQTRWTHSSQGIWTLSTARMQGSRHHDLPVVR